MNARHLLRLAIITTLGALLTVSSAVLAQGEQKKAKSPKSAASAKAARERRIQRRCDRQLLAWSNAAARATLTPMLEAKGAGSSVRLLEGRLLEQEGLLDEALQAFQTAADLDPRHPEPHLRLASVHQRAKRAEPARAHFRAAFDRATAWSEREPENARAFFALGQASQGLGRLPKALAAYKQALELDPNRPMPAYYLGTVYYQQEKWQAALEAFDRALSLNGNIAYAYFFRGLTQGKAKQNGAMLNDLDHFVAMAPTAPEAATARSILGALR
jgi:tetratricopeptide (TPR) repeat protein